MHILNQIKGFFYCVMIKINKSLGLFNCSKIDMLIEIQNEFENENSQILENRLSELNETKYDDLTLRERLTYLVLFEKIKGKQEYLADVGVNVILKEVIFALIECCVKNDLILKYVDLYKTSCLVWLVDFESSTTNSVTLKPEVYDNLHTVLKPLIEDLESKLQMARGTTPHQSDVINKWEDIIDRFITYEDHSNLEDIYNSLFILKWAFEEVQSKLNDPGFKKELYYNEETYSFDANSLVHIIVRHTHRFKLESHPANTTPRGFFNCAKGSEFELINNIIHNGSVNSSSGPKLITYDNSTYQIGLRNQRIVTLYPLENFG